MPLQHLGKIRSKYNAFFGDTSFHDRWHLKTQWTGATRFKILPTFCKMTHDVFYSVSDGYFLEPKAKDKNNLDENNLDERQRGKT